MAKKFFIFAFIGIFLFIAGIVLVSGYDNPDRVISRFYKAVERAEEEGHYDCCIEPACTMCYLGHWKFEKGTCECDLAIKEGRMEDVCPECSAGIEEGICASTKEDSEVCLV